MGSIKWSHVSLTLDSFPMYLDSLMMGPMAGSNVAGWTCRPVMFLGLLDPIVDPRGMYRQGCPWAGREPGRCSRWAVRWRVVSKLRSSGKGRGLGPAGSRLPRRRVP